MRKTQARKYITLSKSVNTCIHISNSLSLDPSLARCHTLFRSLVLLLSHPPA